MARSKKARRKADKKARKKADKKARKAEKKRNKGAVARLPKKKCCVSKTKCKRCPLRMLKEGTLPEGYTVKRRKLVKVAKTKTRKLAA